MQRNVCVCVHEFTFIHTYAIVYLTNIKQCLLKCWALFQSPLHLCKCHQNLMRLLLLASSPDRWENWVNIIYPASQSWWVFKPAFSPEQGALEAVLLTAIWHASFSFFSCKKKKNVENHSCSGFHVSFLPPFLSYLREVVWELFPIWASWSSMNPERMHWLEE